MTTDALSVCHPLNFHLHNYGTKPAAGYLPPEEKSVTAAMTATEEYGLGLVTGVGGEQRGTWVLGCGGTSAGRGDSAERQLEPSPDGSDSVDDGDATAAVAARGVSGEVVNREHTRRCETADRRCSTRARCERCGGDRHTMRTNIAQR